MKLILSICLSIFCLQTFAQNTINLKGVVKDSIDGESLPGATIILDYGYQSYLTDANGAFAIEVPHNEVIIQVKYVGYVPFSKTIKLPKTNFEINLLRVENSLDELLVSGKGSENIKRPVMGVSTLNLKSLEKLPTALGETDILKGLQMLPGISSVGEASNGVNVRGGTTDQNLMLIDDMPIFNPTHMFGLFSAFPSDAVTSFDLYKGNIPARYGGRAAAVLDVKMANPDLQKFKMQGGISMVSNKIRVDAPIIKDKLGIMIAARGSFNDFLLPVISDQLKNLKANFADGAAKLFYNVNSKNTLTLAAYYSYDFFQTEKLGTIGNINSTATQFQYQTNNYSAKWFWGISSKANLQTTLVSSYYQPNTLLPELNSDNKVTISQSINYKQAKTNLNLYLGKHNIEVAADATHYSINPGSLLPGTSTSISEIRTPIENGMELGVAVEDVMELSKKANLSVGLRYSQFLGLGPIEQRFYTPGQPRNAESLSSTTVFEKGSTAQTYGGPEPRIGFSYSLNNTASIKAGYNLARQYMQIVSNTTTPIPTSRWKLSDNNIEPQVSQLYSIGYFKELKSKIYDFSLEGYYRTTQNVLDYKPGADFLLNSTPETEILQGLNKSYGAEFMISKKKGMTTGWLNYTWARSLNQINQGVLSEQQVNGGSWYSANYDRPHTLNASVVINQGVHHDFAFNFTYSTGRPFTTPQGYIDYGGQKLPYYFTRNNDRLPDYHRLDFAWNIYNPKIRQGKFKGNFAFTVYNVLGRKNAYSIFFRPENNKLTPYKLTIFGAPIVSLAYKFKFNY